MKVESIHCARGSGRILDADLHGDGELVVLVRDGDALHLAGKDWQNRLALALQNPLVRFLDSRHLLVADVRSSEGVPNAHVVTRSGSVVRSFSAGDGISDVVVRGSRIVVSYFDEGVFGSDPLSQQGLVVLSASGTLEYGYQRQFETAAVDIAECYALCPGTEDSVWFFAYTKFPLVHLELSTRRQEVFEVPNELHGAGAICLDGEKVYFHGPYESRRKVLAWNRRSCSVVEVGEWPTALRGTHGGRFLGVSDDAVVVVTPQLETARS